MTGWSCCRSALTMGTFEEDQPMKVVYYPGAGGLPYQTGTAISVRCPMAKFRTAKPDRKAVPSDFHNLVRYIIEELWHVYVGILSPWRCGRSAAARKRSIR